MSRKPDPVPTPDHIEPDKGDQREAAAQFRQAEKHPAVVKPPTEGKAN